jgi:phosphatidylserine/phosphatidylglycerophosphate/cardiolipin synthase-like enzyme
MLTMNLENLSQITELKLLGSGQALPHILQSISKAEQSIMIVGPWLDAYFVGNIIDSLTAPKIEVRFIIRIEDGTIDSKTLSALNLAREKLENFQARCLHNLHSKVILIDQQIFYLGSNNWYWYSLHKSLELTVTSNTSILTGIIPEVQDYWENGTPLTTEDLEDHLDFEPIKVDYR